MLLWWYNCKNEMWWYGTVVAGGGLVRRLLGGFGVVSFQTTTYVVQYAKI